MRDEPTEATDDGEIERGVLTSELSELYGYDAIGIADIGEAREAGEEAEVADADVKGIEEKYTEDGGERRRAAGAAEGLAVQVDGS